MPNWMNILGSGIQGAAIGMGGRQNDGSSGPFTGLGSRVGSMMRPRYKSMGVGSPTPAGPSTPGLNPQGSVVGYPGQPSPEAMAGGGIIRGLPGLTPPSAESTMRRYSPIGPRNPKPMLTPSPENMGRHLPRRESITPRLNVRLPRPQIIPGARIK